MVNGDSGQPKNTPAPWVPWTRAGCDVGNVSTANTVLENNNAIVFAAGPTVTAAAASAGDTNVKVASVNGFTVGMHVTIDTGALAESKIIESVGTPGPNGTGITLTTALAKAHANGVPFYGPTATDPTGDMTTVFGEGSPEWNEGRDSQIAPFAHGSPREGADRFRRHRDPLRAQTAASAATTPTPSRTASRTSRAATPASRGSSAPSTSTRRSTAAPPR